ncbi:MAG: hypothetical protein LLG40_13890 [Deltaproteobacteria bacterium]|nr:hypothetical protein [Deltaproteobacteria bacterium]
MWHNVEQLQKKRVRPAKNKERALLKDIKEWIKYKGFIRGVHYDEGCIISRINEVLKTKIGR